GLAHRHDVVDDNFFLGRNAETIRARARGPRVGPGAGTQLIVVAHDAIDLVHPRKSFRLGLRRTAGDDDARAWPLAAQLADRLPRLPHRLGGDGAGVDHDGIGQPG